MAPASDRKHPLARLGEAVVRSGGGLVTLLVRVQPRSSKACVEGVKEGSLRVRLTAPPAGGKANAQLIEALSKEFDIRKSAIRILRGHSSRDKLVEVEGLTATEKK